MLQFAPDCGSILTNVSPRSRYTDPSTPGFGELESLSLPAIVQEATVSGQVSTQIGIFAVECLDTVVGFETCEELFTPKSPHIESVP